MLQEQKDLIYKNFVQLVRECNLVRIMKYLSLKDPAVYDMMCRIMFEEDPLHNNRMILFQLLKSDSDTIFHRFIASLRKYKYYDLADKLENKPPDSAISPDSSSSPDLEGPESTKRWKVISLIIILTIIFTNIFPAMLS